VIQTLLIANRGEVAGRVISTCQAMGIRAAAVYSEADRDALYVRQADVAAYLGPAAASESYLNIEAVIQAAKRVGADAVHPGYGFLAENAEFARKVREAGLIFVGPSAEVIEQMGSKVAAREICREAGVPTVPGSEALDDEELLAWADQHGYPVMLKASAGGGGKGMRRLQSRPELERALSSSRREAEKAFGSDQLYLEKAVSKPRHLEVQIVADEHGRVLHLGVRECSLQRRHQKLIEESPPTNISAELINGLTEAAVKLAEAVNYTSLGTVEFLVDGEDFYFLEMNTRLQVEHPVTEIVTGTDLVQIQLQIAEGKPLGISQHEIVFRGHAIEARITCEDPYQGFLPATGTVLNWTPGSQARYDTTLEIGAEVTPHYDSMVAKVIASGTDRDSALRSLQTSLKSTVLLGVRHNIDFLRYLLSLPEVREGRQHTELVESLELSPIEPTPEQLVAAAATRWVALAGHQQAVSPLPFRFAFEGHPEITVGQGCFHIDGKVYKVRISSNALEVDGFRYKVVSTCRDGCWWVHTPDGTACFVETPRLPVPGNLVGPGSLTAPMPGSVVEVLVEEGQIVEQGQALLKLEAMKMEQVIACPADGTVEKIHFGPGEQVEAGARLITLRSDEE
jgi:3-methylcrotonyl-CoA carboxylase alpha subunit